MKIFKIILLVLFFIVAHRTKAQDIIFCESDTLHGKVLRIGNETVEYQKADSVKSIYVVPTNQVIAVKYKDGTFYKNQQSSRSVSAPAYGALKSFGSVPTPSLKSLPHGSISNEKKAYTPKSVEVAAEDTASKEVSHNRTTTPFLRLDPENMRISYDERIMRSVNNPSINFYLDEAKEYRKKRAIGYLAIPAGVGGILTTLISAFAESPVGIVTGVALIGVTGVSLNLSASNRQKELNERKKAIETFNKIYN
jgi:hypothetical protein